MTKQKYHAQQHKKFSRRNFIKTTGAAVATFTIVPRYVLGGQGHKPPSEKLNIACIGVGGVGKYHIREVIDENVVALCDIDQRYAAKVFDNYPDIKKYCNFREMLDKEKNIEAIMIATPDHSHAAIAMTAMKMGKHVFCEKPLAHTIYETRELVKAARKYKVATQMGNWGHATEEARLVNEWIWDGAIGQISEVHCWTNRPMGMWPQGIKRPDDIQSAPLTLDWDMWLGPAAERPYNSAYLPFKWRGWYDFGEGALGDMGCHIIDHPFWALKLGYPVSVEASSTQINNDTYPLASIVRYHFPARDEMPPVTLHWYDGGLMPQRPPELEAGRRMGTKEGGIIFVGDKGKLMCGCYAAHPRLIPEEKMRAYKRPPKTMPRSIGHYKEWIQACKGGKEALSNFDYAGPLTETVLLGCIAQRMNQQIHWDHSEMKITNLPEANRYLSYEYRQGWSL